MNLKAVHVVFIAASTGLAVMLGTWCLRRWLEADGGTTLLAAIGSYAAAAGLVAYGAWFLSKTRQLR